MSHRLPTVKVRNRATGETMVVNQADWGNGSLTSDGQNNVTGWEIVGEETIGELTENQREQARVAHEATSKAMEAQVRKAQSENPHPGQGNPAATGRVPEINTIEAQKSAEDLAREDGLKNLDEKDIAAQKKDASNPTGAATVTKPGATGAVKK